MFLRTLEGVFTLPCQREKPGPPGGGGVFGTDARCEPRQGHSHLLRAVPSQKAGVG